MVPWADLEYKVKRGLYDVQCTKRELPMYHVQDTKHGKWTAQEVLHTMY